MAKVTGALDLFGPNRRRYRAPILRRCDTPGFATVSNCPYIVWTAVEEKRGVAIAWTAFLISDLSARAIAKRG
jgi:hypothetical protein